VTDNYLPQRSVPWQVSTGESDAARSVLLLGTTAPAAELLANPEWTADLEYVWRTRMAPERDRLQLRARRMATLARRLDPDKAPERAPLADTPMFRLAAMKRGEWAAERARAVAMSRVDVLSTCDQRWRTIACECGRRDIRVACDQPQLCSKCRKRHATLWRRRLTVGFDAALRRERREWYATPSYRRQGREPGIYLLTFTMPHTGDLETDRAAMGPAIRKVLKHADKWGWWKTYALTWEATGGSRDEGHLHVHMAVISSWIPYTSLQVASRDAGLYVPGSAHLTRGRGRGLHELWAHAMPGSIQPDVRPPRRGSDDSASAGGYLAKYVTKGVDIDEFTGRKAGELLVAFRNRRKVSTSAHFYIVKDAACPCCKAMFRMVEAPCSLQDLAPGAVLRSQAERLRWWVPRGEPQVSLRWCSDNGHGNQTN
jgi:hypothetical protein